VKLQRASTEPRSASGQATARSATVVDEHVGGRLRKRRLARGLSQDALARILGVSFQQLHKYETGENRLSVSRLYQLCLVLDVPLEWFFEGLPGKPSVGEQEGLDLGGSPLTCEPGNTLGTEDALVLLRAYQQIDNPRARELLLSLAVLLAGKKAGSGPSQIRVVK
jgi:transcriptional regulator with XRE-family HTH domain